MKWTQAAAAVLLMGFLAGCNTPSSRIKENQELFESFPAEARDKVKAGEVDIGFTRAMVHMALGPPNRVYTRRTATGFVEVLAYTAFETHRDRQRVEATFRVRDQAGYHSEKEWTWVDVNSRNEYDKLRVELVDEKVIAIEETSRVTP